jgi:hypothetical protein
MHARPREIGLFLQGKFQGIHDFRRRCHEGRFDISSTSLRWRTAAGVSAALCHAAVMQLPFNARYGIMVFYL